MTSGNLTMYLSESPEVHWLLLSVPITQPELPVLTKERSLVKIHSF